MKGDFYLLPSTFYLLPSVICHLQSGTGQNREGKLQKETPGLFLSLLKSIARRINKICYKSYATLQVGISGSNNPEKNP